MACGSAAALEMTVRNVALRPAARVAGGSDISAWKCVGTPKKPVMPLPARPARTASGSNRSMISA
jgi:hypothetical protein